MASAIVKQNIEAALMILIDQWGAISTMNVNEIKDIHDVFQNTIETTQNIQDRISQRLRLLLNSRAVTTIGELINQTTRPLQRDRLERCFAGMRSSSKEFYLVNWDPDTKQVTIRGTVNQKGLRSDYKVTIGDETITCNCPDGTHACRQHNLACKHQCFLILRVARILPLYFFNGEQALTTDDRNTLLSVLSNRQSILSFYAAANVVPSAPVLNAFSPELARLSDICPICYEDTPTIEGLVGCPQCKQTMHTECVKVWLDNSVNKTCVMCRYPWHSLPGLSLPGAASGEVALRR